MDSNRKWGFKLLAILLGALALILVANGLLIYQAQKSFTGLSTEKAYERGLAYNQTLKEEAKEKALGWNLASHQEWQGKNNVILTYTLSGISETAIPGATINALLSRPMADAPSQTLVFSEDIPGTYSAKVTLPKQGQWQIDITATQGSNSLTSSQRIISPK